MTDDARSMAAQGDEPLLQEQIRYYRARAPEYDDWFHRRGDYDRGAEYNGLWVAEVEEVRRALAVAGGSGRILELACGTGLWTERLAPLATHLTAVDVSPEVIALNRERVGAAHVRYRQADLFTWEPDERYDFVFFGFWLSHVPPSRVIPFWQRVARAVAPGGRVFFVDSRYHPAAAVRDGPPTRRDQVRDRRRLKDGREFDIVKLCYRPDEVATQLTTLGWRASVQGTANFFLYGTATPPC
jgi:SAM-dependent methyltransferase